MTTFRSKILLIALGLFFAAPAEAVDSNTYSAEKLALAREYIAIVPVETDIKAVIDQFAAQIAPEQRVLFRSIADSSIDYTRLRAAAELAVAEVYTEDEIKAMTKFYKSPEGQSVRAKTTQYDQRMQPVITEVMQKFVQKLQENNVVPGGTPVPSTE